MRLWFTLVSCSFALGVGVTDVAVRVDASGSAAKKASLLRVRRSSITRRALEADIADAGMRLGASGPPASTPLMRTGGSSNIRREVIQSNGNIEPSLGVEDDFDEEQLHDEQRLNEEPNSKLKEGAQISAVPPNDDDSNSASLVILTYCDTGFASIWPVFLSCLQQALPFNLAEKVCVDKEVCNPKLRLSDLGVEGDQHCVRHPMGSLVQSSDTHSHWTNEDGQGSLTPKGVPVLLARGLLHELEQGNDVLRLDADAFLLEDPRPLLDKFPDADIISSPDCAHTNGDFCGWYLDQKFATRHNASDPLADVGFMLNTGLMLIRSNAYTISIARKVADAIERGETTFEQIAFNEELVLRNCMWFVPDTSGNFFPSPGGPKALHILGDQTLTGRCEDDLKVVVLPYKTMQRSMPKEPGSPALSFHPGGTLGQKLKVLPDVKMLCDSRKHIAT